MASFNKDKNVIGEIMASVKLDTAYSEIKIGNVPDMSAVFTE